MGSRLVANLSTLVAVTAVVVAAQQPPTFRSGSDVVQVDAVVQDRDGQFVTGLTAADFEIREDGKPQPVEILYVAGGAPGALSTTAPAAPGTEPRTSAPRTSAPGRVFIAVFDDEHLSAGGFKRVQAAAVDLFSKEFQPGDIGGVVERGQMANRRLTSDKEELLAAVRNAKPNSKSSSRLLDLREWPTINEAEAIRIVENGPGDQQILDQAVQRACEDQPSMCESGQRKVEIPIDDMIREKARRIANELLTTTNQTLTTLDALLNGLARVPNRKTILLLTEGFVAEHSWPLVEQSVALATRADARIYTLDARGLYRERSGGDFTPHEDSMANLLASFDIGADAINSLAVDTGGFVVRNTNIFDKAVAQIAREAGTFYVLGYRPATPQDGKFHRIEVKVKRSGLTVRARRGYMATAKPAAVDTATAESPAPVAPGPKAGTTPETRDTAGSKSGTTTVGPPSGTRESDYSAATVVPAAPADSSAFRMRPDASKHVDALAAHLPPDPDATVGWEAYQRGDVESARTSLAVAAARAAARPWVFYALGQSQYALSDFPAAIDSWEQARRRSPEFEPVYFDLADGYMQTREFDKAIAVLRAARDRWQQDPEVLEAMGVIQVKRGALDDAVKSFEQAIELAPEEALGYYNLGKTLELRWLKSRRYVEITRTWSSNETDRKNAVARYEQYLKIGGPLEASAREGIQRLSWGVK